jgi:hypothetical protein
MPQCVVVISALTGRSLGFTRGPRGREGVTARRTDPNRAPRNHIQQLEALGYTVTLTPVA